MKLKTIISPLAILFLSWALACSDSSDLGNDCTLVKRKAGTEEVEPLTEAEAKRALEGPATGDKGASVVRNLLSLGAAECENLACVRDSQYVPKGGPVADTANAGGYCSEPCYPEGSTCKTGSSKNKTKYVCRQMMLDQETWDHACKVNPANCIDVSNTLYCVKVY